MYVLGGSFLFILKKFLKCFLPLPARRALLHDQAIMQKLTILQSTLDKQDTLDRCESVLMKFHEMLNESDCLKHILYENPKINEDLSQAKNPYWELRKELKYYRYFYEILKLFAPNAKNAIDIGSNGIPFIEKLEWIPERYSLDKAVVYESENVKGIKADFFKFHPEERYDVAICMQVLEHVQDPKIFTNKLFEIAKQVFISVPYQWPVGSAKPWHIHDMIDENTLRDWTGRKPDYSIVVPEIQLVNPGDSKRIIVYYENV